MSRQMSVFEWFAAASLDLELSAPAVRLCAVIVALGQAEHGMMWRNAAELERASGFARRTLARRFAELEACGWCCISPRADGGGERLVMLKHPREDALDVLQACSEHLDGWGSLRCGLSTFKPSLGELAKLQATFGTTHAKSGKRPAKVGKAPAKSDIADATFGEQPAALNNPLTIDATFGTTPAKSGEAQATFGTTLSQKWQTPLYIDKNPTEYLGEQRARASAAPQPLTPQQQGLTRLVEGESFEQWLKRNAPLVGWDERTALQALAAAQAAHGAKGAALYAVHKLALWLSKPKRYTAERYAQWWSDDLADFKPKAHPIPFNLLPERADDAAVHHPQGDAVEQREQGAQAHTATLEQGAQALLDTLKIHSKHTLARILRGDVSQGDKFIASDLRGLQAFMGWTPQALAQLLEVDLEHD